jgi:hypothetical protein
LNACAGGLVNLANPQQRIGFGQVGGADVGKQGLDVAFADFADG